MKGQRHVDHVNRIGNVAVAIWIERELHALQRQSAARVDGATDLDRVGMRPARRRGARRLVTGDDVGDMRAVPAAARAAIALVRNQ